MVPHNPNLPTEPKNTFNTFKRHTNSIIFVLFSSLPLLCFMIFYEIFLEKNLVKFIKISIPRSQDYLFQTMDWPIPTTLIDNLTWKLSKDLILLALLYIPLSILHLTSMILTVDLASKIYKGNEPIGFRELVCRHTSRERLKGILTTFTYSLFLSTCGFLVIICFVFVFLYAKFESFFVVLVSRLAYPAVLACVLLMYLELSVVWNLSLVVSVLEEEYGACAFALSFYACKGKKKGGIYLMLAFIFMEMVTRIPCLYMDDGWVGLVLRTTLLWFAGLVKWVGFVVYYHECKSKAFKKIYPDEENELISINAA